VPAVLLGYSGGASLVVKGLLSLPLSDIKAAHEAWLPGYMAATE
jgi:phosphoribosylformylglycinamidine synthase subunit PurL